jgi:hypothetical protein
VGATVKGVQEQSDRNLTGSKRHAGCLSTDVSGEMKVVESWRFENPFSSGTFSSNTSA